MIKLDVKIQSLYTHVMVPQLDKKNGKKECLLLLGEPENKEKH